MKMKRWLYSLLDYGCDRATKIHIHLLSVKIHIYIYMIVYIYVYTYIYMYIHIYICIFTYIYIYICIHIYMHTYVQTNMCSYIHICMYMCAHMWRYTHMGWLQLVGSLKSLVFFAENSLFYRALLQKRPIILRSLLIVATPYTFEESDKVAETHVYIHKCMYIYACTYVLLYIFNLYIYII